MGSCQSRQVQGSQVHLYVSHVAKVVKGLRYTSLPDEHLSFLRHSLVLSNELQVTSRDYVAMLQEAINGFTRLLTLSKQYQVTYLNRLQLVDSLSRKQGRVYDSTCTKEIEEALERQKQSVEKELQSCRFLIAQVIDNYAQFWHKWFMVMKRLQVPEDVTETNASMPSRENTSKSIKLFNQWKRLVSRFTSEWKSYQKQETQYIQDFSRLSSLFSVDFDVNVLLKWKQAVQIQSFREKKLLFKTSLYDTEPSPYSRVFLLPTIILQSLLDEMEDRMRLFKRLQDTVCNASNPVDKTTSVQYRLEYLYEENLVFQQTEFTSYFRKTIQDTRSAAQDTGRTLLDISNALSRTESSEIMILDHYQVDEQVNEMIESPQQVYYPDLFDFYASPQPPIGKPAYTRPSFRITQSTDTLVPSAPPIHHMKPAPPVPRRASRVQ
ncbi:hypothetical protein EDD86DRAFT_244815 [Gorgonomyces haynaldii]|nr:hypothetical protein EDD86DRAFT_244815 [Gorgonomyces haynaldii]